jgi:hypothetical protein
MLMMSLTTSTGLMGIVYVVRSGLTLSDSREWRVARKANVQVVRHRKSQSGWVVRGSALVRR